MATIQLSSEDSPFDMTNVSIVGVYECKFVIYAAGERICEVQHGHPDV